jgi:hypothetical protein
MAQYEFQCQCTLKAGAVVQFTKDFPMTAAPPIGSKTTCPVCRKKKAVRVISSGVHAIIKGKAQYDWKPGESVRTNINGQDIRFQFVDHPHTDPALQRNLAEMAGRHNLTGTAAGLSNVRYDEKLGRMVVDVASNIRDPLGAIERHKRESGIQPEVRKVNQKFKTRKKKK